MKGKLIVFEGMDGSGKATQSKRLCEYLIAKGHKARRISFPDYEAPSSVLLRMYLNGEFGATADSVNGYVASAFFAVDRVASYMSKWRNALEDGEIIILDRYTTSNMVHQTSKLPREQWDEYLEWLYDFEFKKLGLPEPDLTFYLRVSVEISERQLAVRYGNDESKKDIHEKDVGYLRRCAESGMYSAGKCNWKVIECADNGVMRSIEDIGDEILGEVSLLLKEETL